jgi:CO/xanthine dehydrogenase FAD-binding subunit
MRAYVPEYDLVAPSSLSEALKLVADQARPIAGGTDIMVLFEAGKLPYRKLVSLWRIPELRGIVAGETHVTLGALVTYTEIQQSVIMQREFPLLIKAASWTGAVATQNRGTLAGNIANASPAADSPPALLVYDAEIELLSAGGTRRVPYAGFHTGYKTSVMRSDEIIGHIRLPRATVDCAQYLRKVGARRAQAIAKVALAGLAKVSGGVVERMRIALASVAPMPIRCTETEAAVVGRKLDRVAIDDAKRRIALEISPITDIRSTLDYRRRVTTNLLEEFLEMLLA